MTDTDELHWQLDTGYPHTLRPELHRALMARGIDYWVAQGLTFWNCPDGRECVAYGYLSNGKPRLAVKIVGITDPAQAIAVTLGSEMCKEVYLLMATDIGDGREEVLGAYTTESAATKAISENQFGYAFHHVRKLEVTS